MKCCAIKNCPCVLINVRQSLYESGAENKLCWEIRIRAQSHTSSYTQKTFDTNNMISQTQATSNIQAIYYTQTLHFTEIIA